MKLIADSGSTKTDWRLVQSDSRVEAFTTIGLNPFHLKVNEIMAVIETAGFMEFRKEIREIYFYGAGCLRGEAQETMQKAMGSLFENPVKLEISDDLMAAARATLKNQKGIACILGTGSNSCLYDGKTIVDKVPALGYVLGDEGSGAVMGRKLLNLFYKRELPIDLSGHLQQEYNLRMDTTLSAAYKETLPNRYLAGFTYFLKKFESHPFIRQLVFDSFQEFLDKNVFKYQGYRNQTITFTGSVAFEFREILEQAMNQNRLRLGLILPKPIDELVNYHLTADNDD